jgi:hypothetical protein
MPSREGRSDTRFSIASGGQTGADRAALDAALALGIPIHGWCPRGRWAEDGPIPARYPLRETDSDDPAERTRANVRDADATLVLTMGALDAGTDLTVAAAQAAGKPCAVIDLAISGVDTLVRDWICRVNPERLNIAGPRESHTPGLYRRAREFLEDVLRDVAFDDDLDEPVGR